MRFVAIVLLLLGLVTFDSALNLLGAPSVTSITQQLFSPSTGQPSVSSEAAETLTLQADNYGYKPQQLVARAGVPITLNVVTEETYSCARDFVIPALKFYALLPETGSIPVNIPAQKPGTIMRFTCSMGMYTGQIVFE